MEPISILLSALALGAQALRPAAEQAVKDAYSALKRVVIDRFGASEPKLEQVLAEHAEDPGTYRKSAEKVLKAVCADRDQEVIDLAAALLKHLEDAQPGITGGLVGQINAQGGKVLVVGRDVGSVDL